MSRFKLNNSDLLIREAAQCEWFVKAPVGATPEDVIDPVFWTHVANKLHALDEIRVVAFDGSWYGVFLITFADGFDVRCRQLSIWEIEEDIDSSGDERFQVSWGGPAQKFRVVRLADKAVVQSNFSTRKEAQKWVHERPR